MELTILVLAASIMMVPGGAGISNNLLAPVFTTPYNLFRHGTEDRLTPWNLFGRLFPAVTPATAPYSVPLPVLATFSNGIYSKAESPSRAPYMDTFRGFSTYTKYGDGGSSEVIFVTGPESQKLMESNVKLFHNMLSPHTDTSNNTENGVETESALMTHMAQRKNDFLTALKEQYISTLDHYKQFPNTSPLFNIPIPLHAIISPRYSTLPFQDYQPDAEENADAQESMVKEFNAIAEANKIIENVIKPITSDENISLNASSSDESRTEASVSASKKSDKSEDANTDKEARTSLPDNVSNESVPMNDAKSDIVEISSTDTAVVSSSTTPLSEDAMSTEEVFTTSIPTTNMDTTMSSVNNEERDTEIPTSTPDTQDAQS